MRFTLLFALLVLGCAVAKEPKAPYDHAAHVKQLEREGHIVIESGSQKSRELQYEAIGRVIICMRADVEHVAVHTVTERMFKRGHFSILVQCHDGKLFVREGYL